MKKIIILILTLVIFTGCTSEIKEEPILASYTEFDVSEDVLLDMSESIVIGTFVKHKENKSKTMSTKSADIEVTYDVYKLKVNDFINGEKVNDTIEVIFAFGKPDEIELNKEYMLFLQKNPINKSKYYSLVSYQQGYFTEEVDKDTNEKTWKNSKNLEFEKEKLKKDK